MQGHSLAVNQATKIQKTASRLFELYIQLTVFSQLNTADYSVTARLRCLPYLLLRQYGLSVLPHPEIDFPLQQLSASAV